MSKKRAVERFAYGSVLEALSGGLYPDKRHVIREFVQNSYDSVCELRRKHASERVRPIQIKIQPPSLFIADYGLGMTQSEVRQYRYLGYSQKERAKHAGFRGIGKYAGLAIAEKLIVDTSPLGVPERHRIIIHADRMIAEIKRGGNPPLERVLEEHTELFSEPAKADEHYTFVELHKISTEAQSLLDVDDIKAYLARTAPVPLNPAFGFAKQIDGKLRANVPDFLALDLSVNGANVYKPYFANCGEPEFETVLFEEHETAVLAYCWYCQNSEKGQFDPKDLAGLVFRVKNIAVSDGQLTRGMLWKSTPERAFYFFGEIHVLDAQVTPSSDRTAFEDNEARKRLEQRCLRISSILRSRAGEESAVRRFDEVLDRGVEIVSRREGQVRTRDLPFELKDQAVYEVKKLQEDLQKRLKGPRTPKTVNRAKRLIGRTRKFLHAINRKKVGFLDLRTDLRFDPKLRTFYDCVVAVLREEFDDDPDRLERIIRRIHEYARGKLRT
jgi:molecular chaperone HtpG